MHDQDCGRCIRQGMTEIGAMEEKTKDKC